MAIYVPLSPVPLQFVDTNGNVQSGATLSFFLSGTSTPTNLFSDNAGTSIGNSITLNSEGYPESGGNVITLFRDTSVDVKITLVDGSTVWTSDGLNTELDVLASTANGEGASLVSIEDSGGNYTATTVEAALAELASTSAGEGASILGVEDSAAQLTAATVEAALAEIMGVTKRKAANETLSSSTTLQDDDDLTAFAVATGGFYEITGILFVVSNSTADFKFNLNFTNTPQTSIFYATYSDTSGTTGTDAFQAGSDCIIPYGASSGPIFLKGFVIANASTGGTFKLQWAQNTSDAVSTGLNLGSYIRVRRLP